jgi:7-keto-8-aminopelargonate synthetase-like enzyme
MPRIAPDRGSVAHFARLRGPDLLNRSAPLLDWVEQRVQRDLWPYSRAMHTAPAAIARLEDVAGEVNEGINLASQDYLGLATAPATIDAAVEAARGFGVHSAGSGVLSGGSHASRQLEAELADFVQAEHVLLFPTGWAAGFGAIVGLVRPYDYVMLDEFAHACLHQGATAATQNVRRHAHLDADVLKNQLAAIRAQDTTAGIMIVTEGLYSMDADVPRLQRFIDLAREYNAILLVDQAHDLGSSGPGGTGQLGAQGLLGQADLVMGAFSKTFASNGGFVATNSSAAKMAMICLGGSYTFSNALSPIQVAIVREALRVVRSPEGEQLRQALLEVSAVLRSELAARALTCTGIPSAVNPVPIGSEAIARTVAGQVSRRGVLANLVEFPAVGLGAARLRLQAMATHTPAQMRTAATVLAETISEVRTAHHADLRADLRAG